MDVLVNVILVAQLAVLDVNKIISRMFANTVVSLFCSTIFLLQQELLDLQAQLLALQFEPKFLDLQSAVLVD